MFEEGAISMEIVEGVHKVDGVNANVYLVINEEELTVVDTGMPNSARKILNYVEKINRQPSDISRILLTHCHIDHVGSAHELRKLTNAKIAVHEEDADAVAGKKTSATTKGIFNILTKAFSPFYKFTPVQPDVMLKDKDKIGRLSVIHTPGHTHGSISLYDPMIKVLFVGDAVRFVNGKLKSPSKMFTSNMHEALQSIEKISQIDFNVMLSGHGEPLKTNASDRVKKFYNSFK